MALDQIGILGVLAVLITLLITSRLKPALLFGAAIILCYLAGMIELSSMMANFSNSSLLVLVLLMIISAAIEKTRLISWISQQISSGSLLQVLFKLGISTAFLSSFTNNTAVVASLIGAIKRNGNHAPSRLLIPLSYFAIFGGTLTLIGTSTNLIVNSFVVDAGLPSIGFFDFTIVGLAAFTVGLVMIMLLSPSLPDTKAEIVEEADYFLEAKVNPGSPLIGKTITENNLRNLQQLYLAEIIRKGQRICPVSPDEALQESDILLFCGAVHSVGILQDIPGLDLFAENQLKGQNLVEVIVSHSADIKGKSIKECHFREEFDAVVVAIRRGHTPLQGGLGNIILREGDTLVLAPGRDFYKTKRLNREFVVVSGVDASTRLDKYRSGGVMLGFAAVIGLAVFDVVPLLKGLLVLLIACLVTGTITWNEVKRRFPFEIWVVVGSALTLAQLMTSSGLADMMGHFMHTYFANWGLIGALIAVYVLTWLLTEVITNNAAAALAFPIAYSIPVGYGVDPTAFIMVVIFAASCSFISPYGYQTNLMVYSAGNYRLKNYLKIGIPISIGYSITVLSMIIWLFPF
ncbi:SLC13 family permease [Motilimonas cestriensis]|uniref:SLC13 family permease n=1 Tax=Motilimonas cestriensis TaxID=2742685 RepID=A0ABS8WA15_9GAMM|nr:SLC13 family permease [Motilimonas cestriensis]MCE2594558.1 SLC13 family permease [Motilimonas cestriensis]